MILKICHLLAEDGCIKVELHPNNLKTSGFIQNLCHIIFILITFETVQ